MSWALMTVVAIHIGDRNGGKLRSAEIVRARAGKGLEGDRHFHPEGAAPGQALTLSRDVTAARVQRASAAYAASRSASSRGRLRQM
jgi:hypothetical protein